MDTAILAGGCFWGVQYYFDQIPGVITSVVGYTGGNMPNPSYEQVCTGTTGHAEAIKLDYDPDLIHYETILKHFFRLHDPTQLNRQGPDVGDQYRSAIFYTNDSQRQTAESIRKELQAKYDKPIVTQIEPAGPFYDAEDYHQGYTARTGRGMCHVPYEHL